MRIELTRPWPRVRTAEGLSCGGDQNWFPDRNFRLCGCGVVACADTLLYLTGRGELEQEEYERYVNSLRKYFPLVPHHGIDGVRLAIGLNALLRKRGVRVRAGWSASGARFWDRLARLLANDLPAIVAIGPSFPRVWDAERLQLYRRTGGAYVAAARTKGHFLTVLGLDDDWMRVSSWGQELYIERRAYADYMRRQGALFTNLVYLERMEKQS
ncbi:MAG: hypothetical protein IJV43_03030 [Oscillospiraceae bacterium]|nr:hypothetical protein [Oscillospiraceae bacterium]